MADEIVALQVASPSPSPSVWSASVHHSVLSTNPTESGLSSNVDDDMAGALSFSLYLPVALPLPFNNSEPMQPIFNVDEERRSSRQRESSTPEPPRLPSCRLIGHGSDALFSSFGSGFLEQHPSLAVSDPALEALTQTMANLEIHNSVMDDLLTGRAPALQKTISSMPRNPFIPKRSQR